jgi:hypothetical protein
MGTWGYGVLDDDSAADVHGEFLALLDKGVPPQEIRDAILDRFAEYFASRSSSSSAWLGLARAEWECGVLRPDTLRMVQALVSDPRSLQGWSTDKERARRRAVLEKFVTSIAVPRTKPRRPVRRRLPRVTFEPGTCLAISILDGGWGALIVLDVAMTEFDACHFVGGLRGIYKDHPRADVFEARRWLVCTHGNWKGQLHTAWCGTSNLRQDKKHWTIVDVGRTALRAEDPKGDRAHAGSTSWGWMENQIRLQHRHEGTTK